MKRASQPTTTVCRIVATFHPAGVSKKSGKKYDEFVSFKIHDGKSVTDCMFMKTEKDTDQYRELIATVKSGATTFDVPANRVYRFEKDNTHQYPLVIIGGIQYDNIICYDAPEDLPL